jgi:hypothetical protein
MPSLVEFPEVRSPDNGPRVGHPRALSDGHIAASPDFPVSILMSVIVTDTGVTIYVPVRKVLVSNLVRSNGYLE